MSFETDLRTWLIGDGAIAAKVSARIYWEVRPQGSALPAIVLTGVSADRRQHMAGPMATQGNRVQFDCMAATKGEAIDLRAAVIDRIEGSGVAGTTEFQGGFVNILPGRSDDTSTGVVRTERADANIWFN